MKPTPNDTFCLGLDFYIGLPEAKFDRGAKIQTIQKDSDPEKLFEIVFKAANKEYLQRNQAHKSPLDVQAV